MKEFNEKIAVNKGQNQRILNSSPFNKNLQSLRFGIDGSRKIQSFKEIRNQKKNESQSITTSEIIDN